MNEIRRCGDINQRSVQVEKDSTSSRVIKQQHRRASPWPMAIGSQRPPERARAAARFVTSGGSRGEDTTLVAVTVPAIAVVAVAIVAVAIPAIPVVGSMIVAVVTVAVPGYVLGQPAAPSALIKSAGQACRGGLGRRCNKAERKGTETCRKERLHFHQASPLVLGLFPGIALRGELPELRGLTAVGFHATDHNLLTKTRRQMRSIGTTACSVWSAYPDLPRCGPCDEASRRAGYRKPVCPVR